MGAVLAFASALAGIPAAAMQSKAVLSKEAQPSSQRRMRGLVFGDWTPPRYRRSKNPPDRRRLRTNRLHISRRVRRRHRRRR
ncbi:MAG TPA: hypothetical protein VEC11_07765 [Allosphingosinicella sp.]|nr:hypothetical protein [Allosphingosinicella sp.]